MQKKSSKKSRSRAEILAEIAALPPSVQGTISSYRCPRKNGPPAVYHNLQYTRGGKNHSFSIPVGKVSEFKAAVAAGRKLRDLVFELSLADANEIASSESPLKKARAPRPEGRRDRSDGFPSSCGGGGAGLPREPHVRAHPAGVGALSAPRG